MYNWSVAVQLQNNCCDAKYSTLGGDNTLNINVITVYNLSNLLLFLLPRFVTLKPGDVVLTGTPPGVGCFRKPPLWLKVRVHTDTLTGENVCRVSGQCVQYVEDQVSVYSM